MSYNPDQPRDDNGEWTDGNGNPKAKLSIDQAATRLRVHGWILGAADPWKPGQKETVYTLTHARTGKTIKKTSRDIMRKVG